MPLEYYQCGDGINVRTLSCPFCGEEIGENYSLAKHLEKCEAIS